MQFTTNAGRVDVPFCQAGRPGRRAPQSHGGDTHMELFVAMTASALNGSFSLVHWTGNSELAKTSTHVGEHFVEPVIDGIDVDGDGNSGAGARWRRREQSWERHDRQVHAGTGDFLAGVMISERGGGTRGNAPQDGAFAGGLIDEYISGLVGTVLGGSRRSSRLILLVRKLSI